MEYKEFKPAGQKNVKKIVLITIGSILAVAIIGFGTVTLLRQLKAPTLSNNSQSGSQTPGTPTPVTPEKALASADAAAASAAEKATAGNQEAALVDYKTAYDSYKLADKPDRAAEVEFSIKAIEAALAVPENPGKPTGAKAGKKE